MASSTVKDAPSSPSAEPLYPESLTRRGFFAAAHFDPVAYVNGIVHRSVAPGMPSKSRGKASLSDLGATDASNGEKELNRDEARQIVHNTVDALSEALERVVKLRAEEAANCEACRKTCLDVEADEKAKLAQVRARADAVGSQLRDVEAQLTGAAALTAGIEDALEAASARAGRGRNLVQVVGHFEALTAVDPADLSTQLEALSTARHEGRQKARRFWRQQGRSMAVAPDAFFVLAEANGGSVSTAEGVAVGHGIPEELVKRCSTPAAVDLLRKLSSMAAGLPARSGGHIENVSAMAKWLGTQLVLDVEELLLAFAELYDASAPDSARAPGGAGGPAAVIPDGDDDDGSASDATGGDADKASVSVSARPAGDDEAGGGGDHGAEDGSDTPPPEASARPSAKPIAGRGRFAAAARRASTASAFRAVRTEKPEGGVATFRGTRRGSLPGAQDAGDGKVSSFMAHRGGGGRDDGPAASSSAKQQRDATVSLKDLGIRSPYGRQLLASLDLAARLHTNLTGSASLLREFFTRRTVQALHDSVRGFDLAPIPPLPPPTEPHHALAMDVFDANASTTRAVFEFVHQRLLRESITMHALFGADQAVQHALLSQAIDTVLREFVQGAQRASQSHSVDVINQEVRMSPTSRRRNGSRYVDAMSYHYGLHALLYDTMRKFSEGLPRSAVHPSIDDAAAIDSNNKSRGGGPQDGPSSGDLLDGLSPARGGGLSGPAAAGMSVSYSALVDDIFAKRDAFITDNLELQLFERACQAATDDHAQALLPHPDRPFDECAAHTIKYRTVINFAEKSVRRAVILAPPARRGAAVKHVAIALVGFLTEFVHDELKKAAESAKQAIQLWAKKHVEGAPISAHADAHHGAGRLLLLAQVVLASLVRFLSVHITPHFGTTPELKSEVDVALSRGFDRVNPVATSIVTMVGQAVAAKALSALKDNQHKDDFNISDNDADSIATSQPTKAARQFAECLKTELEQARRLLEAFAAAPEESTVADLALATLAAGGGGGGGSASVPRHGRSSSGGESVVRNAHRRTASLGVGYASGPSTTPRNSDTAGSVTRDGGTPADIAAAAALSSVTTPAAVTAFGGMSLGRIISTALYHGICAHVRQFTVTDAGSVIFKQDVGQYRQATAPLITLSRNRLERRAITMQFDTLREVANLLMVPLDNIAAIRSSGLLRFLHKDELTAFLKMRPDVRRALRAMD